MRTCFVCEECGEGCYEKIEERNKQLKATIAELIRINQKQSKLIETKRRTIVKGNSVLENKNIIKRIKEDIKKKGCSLCGYNKCNRALEFHHLKTKERDISKITSPEILKQEFENNPIVLLCANCHRELHSGVVFKDIEKHIVKLRETVICSIKL